MRRSLARRALSAVLGLGLLLLITLAALLQAPENEVPHSVGNAQARGWRALFLVLGELELAPEVWTAPLADLPAGRHLLCWGAAPDARTRPDEQAEEPREDADPARSTSAPAEREPDPLELARAAGPRSGRHLRRFLVQGGRLLALPDDDLRDWLEREAGLREFEGTTLETFEVTAGPARLLGGEALQLELQSARRLSGLDPDLACEVLLPDAAGEALVLEVPVGRGSVVLVPDASLFDNAALDEGDAALLAVRLVEGLAPGGRLLFDEGALGLAPAPGVGSILLGADLRLASLHALLLALLALVHSAWPREFARDPVRHDLVAPLERARAVAGLAARAGRVGVLALPLRQGVLRRAARRLRVRLPHDVDLAEACGALAAAGDARFDLERWQHALLGPAPSDLNGLAELDRELRSLEARLTAPESRPAAGPSAARLRTLRTHA